RVCPDNVPVPKGRLAQVPVGGNQPRVLRAGQGARDALRPSKTPPPFSAGSEAPAYAGVELVTQTVTEHVDGEHGGPQEDAGEEDVVREDAEERAALGHDVAPGRRLGWDADAEDGQDRLDQEGG